MEKGEGALLLLADAGKEEPSESEETGESAMQAAAASALSAVKRSDSKGFMEAVREMIRADSMAGPLKK